MKHLFQRALVAFSLSLAAFSPSAHAQTGALPSQQLAMNRAGEALDRVVLTAKKVNAKLGYGFFEQGCVFGVMMRPGGSTTESFALTAGQSYVFIGGGDKSTRNVDVILRDGSGRIVKKDTERDAAPFVLFKPTRTGRYTMSLKLASSRRGTAFCAATVLRKGGYNLPLERIGQTVAKAAVLAALVFRGVNGGRFNQDSNTWALYGAVLPPKGSISSDPKPLRPAKRTFMGVGDDRIKDLDVVLLDGRGAVLASDTKNGPAAGLAYATTRGSYSVGLINNSSNGPALVMAVSMELPANFQIKPTSTTTPAQRSPFAGRWSGEWADEGNGQDGEFQMTVQRDGSLTGRVFNRTVGATVPARGFIRSNGAFRFAYSFGASNYIAEGALKFVDDDENEIGGRVTFKQDGTAFGQAVFRMDKDGGAR